jgi:RNA polymerase sigma factor (sigma-70 family)
MTTANSAYDRYIKDISIHPRISRDREKQLWKIIASGRKPEYIEAAVDELTRANLRLVVHCVKSFTNYISSSRTSITVMDLIAEGNLALVKAAENFNPGYQTEEHAEPIRFSAYACKCIKNAMRKAFRKARFIHIPDHHFGYWKQIKDICDASEEEVSDEVLRKKLEIGESRMKTLRQGLTTNTVMLEDMAYDDGYSHWSDFIADDNATCPHTEYDSSDLRDYLVNQMDSLPARTREMLSMMFLSDSKPTLHDLSMRFGVSKERCRQVCARGLQLLRNQMQTTWDHVEHVEAFATAAAESMEDAMVFFPAEEKVFVA